MTAGRRASRCASPSHHHLTARVITRSRDGARHIAMIVHVVVAELHLHLKHKTGARTLIIFFIDELFHLHGSGVALHHEVREMDPWICWRSLSTSIGYMAAVVVGVSSVGLVGHCSPHPPLPTALLRSPLPDFIVGRRNSPGLVTWVARGGSSTPHARRPAPRRWPMFGCDLSRTEYQIVFGVLYQDSWG
jgi:hypothetical protein